MPVRFDNTFEIEMSKLSPQASRHFVHHRITIGDVVEVVLALDHPDDDGSAVGKIVGASAVNLILKTDRGDEQFPWEKIKVVVIGQKAASELDTTQREITLVEDVLLGQGAQGSVHYGYYTDDPEREVFVVKQIVGTRDVIDRVAETALDFVGHKQKHLVQYTAVRRVDEGRLWILMPLIKGRNLEQELGNRRGDDRPPLSEVTVCSIMYQLSEALQFMHENYVPRIHQDVKLANVMLTGDDVVTLIDVDISWIVGNSNMPAAGTFEFMAPEVAFPTGPARTTCASDIFSLGAILFALLANPEDLTLRHPTHGVLTLNATEWTPQTLGAALRAATRRWDYSVATVDTLVAMLQHDPDARPTANQLKITFSDLYSTLLCGSAA